MDNMESFLLAESLKNQNSDNAIFEIAQNDLRSEIASWTSLKLLSSTKLDDSTTLAFSMVKREINGSSAILMSTLHSNETSSKKSALFLGLKSADVLCGAFASVNGMQLYATGDADGSVTLFSCSQQNSMLADLDCSDSRSRPVLKIIHQPCTSDSNMVCFWVAYPDSIEQIACSILDGSVTAFVRTLSLNYDQRDFGSFSHFEMLDSRFGRNSFLALHFLKQTVGAVIVPLNILYAERLCDKTSYEGFCQEKVLDLTIALQIPSPKGCTATHAAVHPSSVRSWSVCAPVPSGPECDVKTLLSSFSFTASALLNDGTRMTGHLTTAEQRIVDTITEIGVEAFLSPDSDVSYSHSKNISSDDKGTVLIFQRHESGDDVTSLSASQPPLNREKKANLSVLWRACLELKMFGAGREEGVMSQCSSMLEEADTGSNESKQDLETDRLQRLIVLESALAAGLGSILAEYVLAPADSTNLFSREFLLADVGAIFVWTEGVYRNTAEQTFLLTQEMVVPYLVHRGSENASDITECVAFDHTILSSTRSELVSYISTLDAAALLLKALYTRKKSSFGSFRGSDRDDHKDKEAREEHEAALCVLGGLSKEVRTLLGVLRTLLILFDYSSLQLSSVAYDSPVGLSLTQLRLSRLERAEDMLFLSPSLCSELSLGGELINRTHTQIRSSAVLPKADAAQKRGEPLDPAFYTALARFLWLPLLSIRAELKDTPKSPAEPSDQNPTTAAQSVVIYALLDALLLSDSQSDHSEMLCRMLGDAYEMRTADRVLLYSLWRVDSRIDIQRAVENLCSPAIALFRDTALFLAVARRLLSCGARKEAKELLTHSSSQSELMQSEVGILALTAASVERDVWQVVISSAKKAVCEMLCRWALLSGELGSFLESVMDDEEQEVVFCILKGMADREIGIAMLPAPCVDTLILWLAMNRRAKEAMQIHEAHAVSLRSLPHTDAVLTLLRSVALRKVLLQNYLMFPPIPHRVLRDVRGRLMETPLHTYKSSVPTFQYPVETETSDLDESQEPSMDIPTTSSFSSEGFQQESFSPYVESMARTPWSKKEQSPSSSYSDGNQSFATAATNAKDSWTHDRDASFSGGTNPEAWSERRPSLATPSLKLQNHAEELFSPPVRAATHQQPFSLPFNSATKKIGFLTGGDVTPSTSGIREAFQDMTGGFSPVDFSASVGRLPIRRKVRFSEG